MLANLSHAITVLIQKSRLECSCLLAPLSLCQHVMAPELQKLTSLCAACCIRQQQHKKEGKMERKERLKLWKYKLSADLGCQMTLNSIWMSVWSWEGQLLPKGNGWSRALKLWKGWTRRWEGAVRWIRMNGADDGWRGADRVVLCSPFPRGVLCHHAASERGRKTNREERC